MAEMFPRKVGYGAGNPQAKSPPRGLWTAKQELPPSAAHPFYVQLNELPEAEKFEEFAEAACRQFYARKMGRMVLVLFVRPLTLCTLDAET